MNSRNTSISALGDRIRALRQELTELQSARRYSAMAHTDACQLLLARTDAACVQVRHLLDKGGEMRRYLKTMKRAYGADKADRPPAHVLERQIHLLALSHHVEAQRNALRKVRKINVDTVDGLHRQLARAKEERHEMLKSLHDQEALIMNDGKAKSQKYQHTLRVQRLVLGSIVSKVRNLQKVADPDAESKGFLTPKTGIFDGTFPIDDDKVMEAVSKNFRQRISNLMIHNQEFEQSLSTMLMDDELVAPRWQTESESFSLSLMFQRSKSGVTDYNSSSDELDLGNNSENNKNGANNNSSSNSSIDFGFVSQVRESLKTTVSKLINVHEETHEEEEEESDEDSNSSLSDFDSGSESTSGNKEQDERPRGQCPDPIGLTIVGSEQLSGTSSSSSSDPLASVKSEDDLESAMANILDKDDRPVMETHRLALGSWELPVLGGAAARGA